MAELFRGEALSPHFPEAITQTLKVGGKVLQREGIIDGSLLSPGVIMATSQFTIDSMNNAQYYGNNHLVSLLRDRGIEGGTFVPRRSFTATRNTEKGVQVLFSRDFFEPMYTAKISDLRDRQPLSNGSIFLFDQIAMEALGQSAKETEVVDADTNVPVKLYIRSMKGLLAKDLKDASQLEEISTELDEFENRPDAKAVVRGASYSVQIDGKTFITVFDAADFIIRKAALAPARRRFINEMKRNFWFSPSEDFDMKEYEKNFIKKIRYEGLTIDFTQSQDLLADYINGRFGRELYDHDRSIEADRMYAEDTFSDANTESEDVLPFELDADEEYSVPQRAKVGRKTKFRE